MEISEVPAVIEKIKGQRMAMAKIEKESDIEYKLILEYEQVIQDLATKSMRGLTIHIAGQDRFLKPEFFPKMTEIISNMIRSYISEKLSKFEAISNNIDDF